MSTTPSSLPAAPHATWYARAGTWFLKIGQAIKGAILKISSDMPAVQAEIAKVAPTVEKISELLLPGSSAFEQHLLDVWGVAANAVKVTGDAAAANGINISLDQSLVNDIKGFLPAVEAYMHPAASPSPAPAAVTSAPSTAMTMATPTPGASMTFGAPGKSA